MNKKILIVDDEKTLVKALRFSLEKEGYEIDAAYDGKEAVTKITGAKEPFDLIILDLMLPEMDGFEVCRMVRKKMDVPIIMLTAKGEDIDKVLGLELGADDYLTKPFNPRELIARIRSIFRRVETRNDDSGKLIKTGDLVIDLLQRTVLHKEKEIELTSKEFSLLSFFTTNPGKVFSREELLQNVWGYNYFGDARTVDVHIRHLREKVEYDPGNPELIVTVWGTGYKFVDPADA